ncbi:AfsA-related hotdog domain-containing protein [Streptomyces sp. NBC_00582]|uniref:AfsA-related hotdog domain-containing protein n=1 Tax=Streptomyces sp. NBC_00582 TaxID=2975783 RepID=UPI002E81274C|nr:AfsA-related hotdog domain-containing protein [Streptomyces sp. NBC_00582]WUB64328.1 A-factor biosynthesis protein [Streptomyces sp. NBC_00582]
MSTIDTAQTPSHPTEPMGPMAKLGEYTHLRHTPAILVRDWRRQGPDTFTVTVRWPEYQGPGAYDPRLLTQTIRQSGLLVAHAAYGVPTGHQTLLSRLTITAEPGLRARTASEFEVDIAVTRTGGRSASLAMEFRIRRGGATVCLADTEFGWVSPAAYRRVRGSHLTVDWGRWPLPAPVAPVLVGRAEDRDVLLSPAGREETGAAPASAGTEDTGVLPTAAGAKDTGALTAADAKDTAVVAAVGVEDTGVLTAVGTEDTGVLTAANAKVTGVVAAAGTAEHQHRWRLRNDVSHTLLFDHPVDHVPGLVLLEAAHQAAQAVASPTPLDVTHIAIGYERYVEFDEPCWIQARPLPTLVPHWFAVAVTGHQGGQLAFQARLRGLRQRP